MRLADTAGCNRAYLALTPPACQGNNKIERRWEYALYLRVRDAFMRLSKVSTEVNVSKPQGVLYYNVV